jgi:hypothetical protein
MEVRHEDKYYGLIPTFLAVWKVSTSLWPYFVSDVAGIQGTRHTGLL